MKDGRALLARETIRELTKEYPDGINQLYKREAFSRKDQEIGINRINMIIKNIKGRVLDVGCSGGILSILAARKGHYVVGIDMLPEAISMAEQECANESEKVKNRVEFKIAWAEELPFPDNCFDSVVLGEILEHALDPRKTLAEARRVLVPGGRAIITVPNGELSHPTHLRTYTKRMLTEHVKKYFQTKRLSTDDANIFLVAIKRKKALKERVRNILKHSGQ